MEETIVTITTLKLPATLAIGKTIIWLEPDEGATQDFIDGMTAGHLLYMSRRKAPLFDTDLILLVAQRQHMRSSSLAFNTGLLVGYLSTLARKGVYQVSNASFCEGHHEGLQAYCLLGRRHTFTQSELCSLIGWKHREQSSAYNAGYMVGFIQSMTLGMQAVLPLVRER